MIPKIIECKKENMFSGAHSHVYLIDDDIAIKVLRRELTNETKEFYNLEKELNMLILTSKIDELNTPTPLGIYNLNIKSPYTGKINNYNALVMSKLPGIKGTRFNDWHEKKKRIEKLLESQINIAINAGFIPEDVGLHNLNYHIETDKLYLFDLGGWKIK